MTKQQSIIADLPTSLQNILINSTVHENSNETLSFFHFQTINAMQQATGLNLNQLGLLLLPLAASFAVTPVSGFEVGAVAFDSMGNAYLGANFEFANTHIGQTIHAEQSAISHAWQRGATDLQLLVINYAPCGHCRQFINEVNLTDDFCIQLPDTQAKSLNYYLPESFGGSDLGIEDKLLGTDNSQIIAKITQLSNANNLAKLAHGFSHAPYSGNKNGIALVYEETNNTKEIITGRYAENAAFNPSLPALQVALNYRRMQGKQWEKIKKAVMVETITSLSQKKNTEALLQQFSDIELEYIAHV